MSIDDILELMKLRGWSSTQLAGELDLTQHAVDKWLKDQRVPSGPAAILMRQWLEAARSNGKPRKKELATA